MLGKVRHHLCDDAARSRVVPAVKPDFASLRQMLENRSPRQPLQAGRPFSFRESPRDGGLVNRQERRAPQSTNGHGGIADLVSAPEARQRQVEQASLILIDKRARFLMRDELLPENIE